MELFFIAGSGDDDVIRDHAGEIVGILRLRVFFVIDHVPHVAGAFFIEADGGIGEATVAHAAAAGVDVCVAGTAVFKAENAAAAIAALQKY